MVAAALPFIFHVSSLHQSPSDMCSVLHDAHADLLAQTAHSGAVLIRGLPKVGANEFREAIAALGLAPLRYAGGDAPRTHIVDGVYTSTSLPPEREISMHNEKGYSNAYPELVAFYCSKAATKGGETPLCDGRLLLEALPRDLVSRFESLGVTYIQNLQSVRGSTKTWQETFETDDQNTVNVQLNAIGATFQWQSGVLRVLETVPAVITHDINGQRAFFCQADRWHHSHLPPPVRSALLADRKPEELYHHCRFGDGSEIPETLLEKIRSEKLRLKTTFTWEEGDILLVDNALCLHGRNSFEGERHILACLANRRP